MSNTLEGTAAVNVLSDSRQTLAALQSLTEWADDLYLTYAWASSDHGRAAHWNALPVEKIRMAIVGIHFAQTEPFVLQRLSVRTGILRVVEDTAGVYHPKVVVGTRDNDARVLMGSSNFTPGGFAGNTELNLLLQGARESSPLSRIIEFVQAQWRGPRSFEPDADWLARYEVAYAQRPLPPLVPRPPGEVPVVRRREDLDVSWAEYYELIKAQERRTLANNEEIHVFDHERGSYLQEAEACREVFAQNPEFAAMPTRDRQLVAGWGGSSGYFGRMVAAGYFKEISRERPQDLGRFLDAIPLSGDVPREQVERCLTGLRELHGVGIGAATRLLCVKRPDLFVPLNNANRRRIRELFGHVPDSVRGYLDLHEQIGALPWMHAREPVEPTERRVWMARAALLDSLLYEALSPDAPPPGFAAAE